MRVLLTGGSGFVGWHLAGELVRAGDEVHSLTLAPAAEAPGVRPLEGDLLRSEAWKDAVARVRPEACVHLAWLPTSGDFLSSPENADHVAATIGLARCLLESGCRRFVGVGTCFEYASAEAALAEDAELGPHTFYGQCKKATFEVLSGLFAKTSCSFAWARPFFLYGPREHERRLVPAVARALLRGESAKVTTGEQVRDFLHVTDAALAVAATVRSDLQGVVNIGSGAPVRVRDVVSAIAEACGPSSSVEWGALPQRTGDPKFLCADNAKLRSMGWAPRFDLRTGVADAVDWWRAHG